MILNSTPVETLSGNILIPSSKSHTIRAVAIALLAKGESILRNPLDSGDGLSALAACEALGAKVEKKEGEWHITGRGKDLKAPKGIIDVGNSGTTMRIMTSVAGLLDKQIKFDGDASIRKRPNKPLLDALAPLGITFSPKEGTVPFTIKGPLKGGSTKVSGISSQYLTSLLITAPLLDEETTIEVDDLREKPYVEITLSWLNEQGIIYSHKNLNHFKVKPGQEYSNFDKVLPGDWSGAAFPLCASVITNSTLTLEGLDLKDSQGDKKIVDFLRQMGAEIKDNKKGITVSCNGLKGIEMDLNDTPDMLPAMAVIATKAKGTTHLTNVPQARIKECDRIRVMREELEKMGAKITEEEDGLLIEESTLTGAVVDGHDDHRVIMALACAGLIAKGKTTIKNAGHTGITFPGFVEKMNALGCKLECQQ